MSNPLSSTLLLKEKKVIKRCTPLTNACRFLGVYGGSSCGEERSVFTPRPVFWSWDLQDAVKPCSPKNCCWTMTMPTCSTTRPRSFITVTVRGKMISGHERSRGAISRRDSQSPRVGAMVSPQRRYSSPGRFDG